jgi:hypothetical protein
VKRFLLYPGYVGSTYDGDEHYISGADLAKLYRVDPTECVIYSQDPEFRRDREKMCLVPLYPLRDGKYVEHLEQIKVNDFQKYYRARRLFEFHESKGSRVSAVTVLAKERLSKSISWHEMHWPDFPDAYQRLRKD